MELIRWEWRRTKAFMFRWSYRNVLVTGPAGSLHNHHAGLIKGGWEAYNRRA